MTARVTMARVNAVIADLGIDGELVRGAGYYWVAGPGTDGWTATMICVYRLNHLTLDQWREDIKALRDDKRNWLN